MSFRFAVRVLATLSLASLAAWLCVWARTPIPWMLGPLLFTAALSILGVRTASWAPLRDVSQWVLGIALGLYFTAEVGAQVLQLWWALGLAVVWALIVGWAFGAWLHWGAAAQVPGSPLERRATTYFAGAIGGASEMTLLADREGGRADLVASAHSLRILIVTILLPFAVTFSGLQALDLGAAALREVLPARLAALAAAALAGGWLLSHTRIANPWLLGPLLVSAAWTMGELPASAMPAWAGNAAQLVIGVNLGVRFRAEFLRTAPRWLALASLGTVGMVILCALFGVGLAWLSGLHPLTLVLATAPGGIAEMAITAKVLQLGAPIVTAFQVCRLLAVLVILEPLFRFLYRRRGPAGGQA